tara:strand:- start:5372 stop:8266 length:2895 start_codon:yes stop_codon:yes gene_type:complete
MTTRLDPCDIIPLTETQNKYFDKAEKFKQKFDHLVDADALAFAQFKKIFHVDMNGMGYLSDAELSGNWNKFEKSMDVLANQIETGKISNKMGRVLWTTQELAERNPIMAKVYDNFVNTSMTYKGKTLKSETAFKDIIDYMKTEIITNQNYVELSKRRYPTDKKAFDRAVERAEELQNRVEELQVDAENKVPGAVQKYNRALKEMSDFLVNGEGKIFNDFVTMIEVGLPKIGKEVDLYYKEKFELQERNKNKPWTGVSRNKLMSGIKKRLDEITIPQKEIIDGSEVVTEVKISPTMQQALLRYIDYTADLHKTLEKGVEAYVDGAMLAIENQFSPIEKRARIKKLENIKNTLKENLTPDYKLGYYPHFRIDMGVRFLDNLMPNADALATRTLENINWSKKGIDEAIADIETYVSNRLKGREENVDPLSYSRNFPAVLKRYASEVNRFNNVAFVQKYTREALHEVKKIYRKGKELDGISQYFVEMVEDMNYAMLGKRDIDDPFWANARQTLLGLEYMSKLGWNFRTATKNSTQGILNWVFLNESGFFSSPSKRFYERKGAAFEGEVRLMMEEAGLSFASGSPELQETLGNIQKSGRQIVKLTDGYSIEFKKPSFGDKLSSKVGNFAGKGEKFWQPSFMMQKVENFNRMNTFKIAFAKMYQELETSPGFRQLVKDSGKDFNAELRNRARNYAIRMTNMLHFDYADVSKSKLLRHPLGRFVFQFQHYLQKFLELNKKALYDDMKIAYKKGLTSESQITGINPLKWNSELGVATRMGFAYTAAPALISMMFDINAFNLIEHAGFDKGRDIFAYFTGDEEEIRQATFGRGAVGAVGFPLLSDILTLGEISNMVDMQDDDWLKLLTGYNSYRKQDKELKTMAIIGLINTQLKRTVGQTWPLFRDGSFGTAVQFEAGLYRDKNVNEMQEKFYKTARAVAPDLAEYYEDTQDGYNKFVSKYKRQERLRYHRGY